MTTNKAGAKLAGFEAQKGWLKLFLFVNFLLSAFSQEWLSLAFFTPYKFQAFMIPCQLSFFLTMENALFKKLCGQIRWLVLLIIYCQMYVNKVWVLTRYSNELLSSLLLEAASHLAVILGSHSVLAQIAQIRNKPAIVLLSASAILLLNFAAEFIISEVQSKQDREIRFGG